MKRVLTLALAAFLVISSTGFALALNPLQTRIVVAWDESSGSQMTDHATLIANLGDTYTVETVNIQGGIVEDILADIDMLVITSACGGTSYIQDHWCETADWVREGGRLFLLNDYWGGCASKTEGFVSSLLGDCTRVPDSLGDRPQSWLDPNVQTTFEAGSHYDSDYPSLLFNGVDSWGEYDGASRYVADEGAVVTTEPNGAGYPAMIARQFGEGCAVMVGDSDWIRGDGDGVDDFIDDPDVDNLALAQNVFRYLEHCGPWDNPGRLVRGRGNINGPSGEDSFVVVAKYSRDGFGGKLSLETAGWDFVGDSFKTWLTAGNEASFEGTGTIYNKDGTTSQEEVEFKVWAGDGTAESEGEPADSFRISIPDASYDNCVNCEDPYNVPINKGRIAIQGKE